MLCRTVWTARYVLALLLLTCGPGAVWAQQVIGVVAMVHNEAWVNGKLAEVNAPVYVSDLVKTGKESGLTILFNDESILTLGDGSTTSIETFTNKPQGQSQIYIQNGQFQYFPGDIVKNGGKQLIRINGKAIGFAAEPIPERATTGTERFITTAVACTDGGNCDTLNLPGEESTSRDMQLSELGLSGNVEKGGGKLFFNTGAFIFGLNIVGNDKDLPASLPPAAGGNYGKGKGPSALEPNVTTIPLQPEIVLTVPSTMAPTVLDNIPPGLVDNPGLSQDKGPRPDKVHVPPGLNK